MTACDMKKGIHPLSPNTHDVHNTRPVRQMPFRICVMQRALRAHGYLAIRIIPEQMRSS
jgi:hypothetical protein